MVDGLEGELEGTSLDEEMAGMPLINDELAGTSLDDKLAGTPPPIPSNSPDTSESDSNSS